MTVDNFPPNRAVTAAETAPLSALAVVDDLSIFSPGDVIENPFTAEHPASVAATRLWFEAMRRDEL